MGFRGKLIITLTLVAGAVVLTTSLMYAASLTRLSVAETRNRLDLLASTFYHQVSRVIRSQAGRDLKLVLASDPSLRAYAEAIVGYSPTTLYVAITDTSGITILHSDPRQEGKRLSPAESVLDFSKRTVLSQFVALGRGHRALEVELPFMVDELPFGAVRVAVSTLFLREQLSGAITSNAMLAAGVVLAAFLASFYLANQLLAPIEILRRELARIDPGSGPLQLRSVDDISRIGEFFTAMSRRLADDRRVRDSGSSWLEAMMGGLSDAVMVVSSERRILSLNTPACELLGRARDEAQGKRLDELVDSDHPLRTLVGEALDRGEAVGPRSAALMVDGREVPHTLSAQILKEADGLSGVLLSARDLEKLSRLGSHLSYTQKLAALGRLTSGVAHEIKNPLNAMVIHVALLRQKLARVTPEARGHLDVLDEQIRRLDRVIQGFLKFTRPEELQLDAVSLSEVLHESLKLVSGDAEKNGVRLNSDIPRDLPLVHGDRELLQQAFLNVLLNAKEAMPGGGVLNVAARGSADGHVRVDIEDTGVGIPPAELPKIFDLYYTSKEAGSGIGLSVVYRIVQLHDGEVAVDSTPGEGTRFTITLPGVRG